MFKIIKAQNEKLLRFLCKSSVQNLGLNKGNENLKPLFQAY